MKKDWWFKFEHLAWLTDEQLNRCSLETQGFWIRSICIMHKSATAKLFGTEAELVRLLSVTPAEFRRCVAELSVTKAATVTQTAKSFTLMSRKFAKELKTREQSRLRKQRERRHAEVTDKSQDRVISKSKEKEIREEKKESTAHAPDPKWLDSVSRNPAYKHIRVKDEFEKARLWADTNSRDFDRPFFVAWLNRIPEEVKINGTNRRPSEREKSAQRTINAQLMADAIGRGDDEAVRRILEGDGGDHSKGYLPS